MLIPISGLPDPKYQAFKRRIESERVQYLETLRRLWGKLK